MIQVNVHTFAHIAAKALPIMEINVPIFDKHIWGKNEIIENEIKINTLFLYSMCEIIIMIFKVLQFQLKKNHKVRKHSLFCIEMFSGPNTWISGFLMLNTEDIDITPSKPAGHQVTTMSASLYYSA